MFRWLSGIWDVLFQLLIDKKKTISMGILRETIKRGDTRMSTSADKKKRIGWAVSILIPFIIAFIPVSVLYDYAVYDFDHCL